MRRNYISARALLIALSLLLAVFANASENSSPTAAASPKAKTYSETMQGSFNDAWHGFVELFFSEEYQFKTLDYESGIIVSEQIPLSGPLGEYAECEGVKSTFDAPLGSVMGEYTIIVQSQSESLQSIDISVKILQQREKTEWDNVIFDSVIAGLAGKKSVSEDESWRSGYWFECISNGGSEESMFRAARENVRDY